MIRSLVAFSTMLAFAITAISAERPLRYVSIDGGGLAVLAPITWLKEIERQSKKPIYTQIDGVIGNSAGAIVAASLCSREPGRDRPLFSVENFNRSFVETGLSFPILPYLDMDSLLEQTLSHTFGDAMLSQALCHLLIGTYDREKKAPHVFENRLAARKGHDLAVWQVVRASASIDLPFIGPFSSYRIQLASGESFGLMSDPALHDNNDPAPWLIEKLSVSDPHREIVIYSLGTGEGSSYTKTLGNVTIVRIEPDFMDVLQSWGGYLRSFLPLILFRTSAKILDIRLAAERALRSDQFKRMLKDFLAS